MPLKSLSFVVHSDGSQDRRPGRYSLNVNFQKLECQRITPVPRDGHTVYQSSHD
jgi:hypothetical protein